MAQPVIVDFILRGMPDVARAFRTVEQAAAAASRSQTTTAQRGARERVSAAEREAREKIASMRRADAASKAAQDRATRDVVRQAGQRAKAEERAERDAVRAAERAANERLRISRAVDREFAQMSKRRERDNDRVLREGTRLEERAARDRARLLARESNQRAASARAFARGIGQGIVTGTSNAVSGARAVAGRVAGVVGQLGGGFSIADSLQGRVNVERQAAQIANQSNTGKGSKRVSTQDVMTTIKTAAIESSTDQGQIAEAMNAYVAKNPDFKGAAKNLGFFGKVAKATGADVKDVASTAGTLAVQNKNLDEKAMRQLILDAVVQTRKGSMEFSDAARAGAKITRSSAAFAGDQTENQRKLMGLAQLGMRTSGSAEESATMLSNVSQDAAKHRDKVQALLGGKSFMNAKGQIEGGPDQFIANVMKAAGGDLTKLQGAGFGARSMKMMQALAPTFNDAEKAALASGATKKDAREVGRQAVLKEMGEVTATGKYDEKDLQKDFAEVLSTSAEKFEGAVRQLKEAVADKLLPELVKLVPVLQAGIPSLTAFMDKMIALADWAARNPIQAAILTLGASITKEVLAQIVSAKIGETIKAMLGGGGGPGGAAGGGSKVGAAIGAGAVAGAATYAVTKPGIDAVLGGQTAGQRRAGELTAMIKAGGAQREEALAEYQKMREQYAGGDFTGRMKDTYALAPNAIYSAITGEKNTTTESMQKRESADRVLADETLKQLVAELRANTEATRGNTRGGAATSGGGGDANKPAGAAASTGIVQRTK